MLVDAPAAGFEPKSPSTTRGGLERAVAVAQRDIDACIAETDDVGATVAGDVGEKSRVLVDAPSAGFVSEVVDASDESNGSNVPSPLLSATLNSRVAEARRFGAPSPVMSARKRGCLSTRQPPAS